MKGIYNSIEDLKEQSGSNLRKSNFKWIICIVSTPDTSNFNPKICRKIEKEIKEFSINLLVISVGDIKSREFQELYKVINFNDTTIFLNIADNCTVREEGKLGEHTSCTNKAKNRIPKSVSPSILQLRNFLNNISNIEVAAEDLIYEKF